MSEHTFPNRDPGAAICVLGMHRSGTSVLARLLNLVGVDLGPQQRLLAAAPDNPKGFWEHTGIIEINEAILAASGGSWCEPPAKVQVTDELRQRARQMLAAEFGRTPLWGWKDPRTCLTLPFWLELVRQPRLVIAARRPREVVRSLARRDNLSTVKAVHLWLSYTRASLNAPAECPRMHLFYEDVMQAPIVQLERLAHFVGRPERGRDQATREAAARFLDPDLYRSRAAPQSDAPADPGEAALRCADRAYQALREAEPGGYAAALSEIDAGLAAVNGAVRAERREREEVLDAIREAVPQGARFALIDAETLGLGSALDGRPRSPFPERHGVYWGVPTSDSDAIAELLRQQGEGARYLVLADSAFWWLEHFTEFAAYLREHCPQQRSHPRLQVFALDRLNRSPVRACSEARRIGNLSRLGDAE